MRNRQQEGMALITALLVLLLISSMIVGMSWLVMTDQRLGGNNADRQKAFYGAESGMEALTTSLSNTFDNNYALSAADITNIINTTATTTTNIPQVQYLNPDGTNGFMINFTKDTSPTNLNNPLATNHTILSGTYAGLVGLLTPYTLQVTSRTAMGSEARLQRTVQTVAIPVFQFGIFSDTDLSFFAGPNFDFGGRVHTNGNLWLAEGDGSTLTMRDKVTAVGEVVRTNLENGWPLSTAYNGTVSVTKSPGSGSFGTLGQTQGSTTGTSFFGSVGPTQEPAFKIVSNTYNGNIGDGFTGVKTLDLTIATPAIGGTAIDMLRPPQPGELAANPGKLAERYYSQASLRIMLSDYGPSGQCGDSDLNALDYASANAAGDPVDLASLAWDATSTAANGLGPVGKTPMAAWLTNQGVTVFPLPVSAAQNAAYTATDGYWVQKWFPIETGCIKIDFQTKAGLAWVDVTQQILNLGFTGRNLNQQTKATMTAKVGAVFVNRVPFRLALPGAQLAPSACADPSPNAIIRLARVRDNPSSANANGGCGNPYSVNGTDYVPNVLYDTREGILRDDALAANATNANGPMTLAGAMSYIELDVNNLDKWFTGAIPGSGSLANNTTGYTVYFSDRRGNRKDPNAPASVGVGALKTGAFGYDDIVNRGSNDSCPDGALDNAEDFESDFTHGTDLLPPPAPRTYDTLFPPAVAGLNPTLWTVGAGKTPIQLNNTFNPAAAATPIQNHPKCGGPGNSWPFATALNGGDLRLNPPVYFRRALKVVNGSTITLGSCDGVACGLSIVSENPVYVQGDYNAGANGNFGTAFVAAAVMGDAVTLLSNNWNDVNSFAFPYALGSRTATTTTYRTAIVGGKTIPFKQPGGGTIGQDFGTDGGVHNFLRYLENWGGQTLWYKGSIVALFYSHQGAGTFKCCNTVYSPPTRGYSFQTEFLTPSLLPPRTPMFRDINTIGFTQLILPTQ
ncbi:MAG: PilX N-terminal domain-containing pilus assembly protein [Candidatus Acidiferrales bacterium]